MGRAIIVGAGPAGLMAAEALAGAGHAVTVADRMPSPARKFLMAGKSGLNLTMNIGMEAFLEGFGPGLPDQVAAAVRDFGPAEVIAWAEGLGQPVFTGSTGRVFPETMKASPLLRAWLARLGEAGVRLERRWTWTGWAQDGLVFATPEGRREERADAVVLACGGASWPRLGSDGAWTGWLGPTEPFAPANAGIRIDWSPHMAQHFGSPVKGVALQAGPVTSRGEWVVTRDGIEGGGVYAISRAVREGAALTLDLLPDLPVEEVARRLATGRRGLSLSETLRRGLRLTGVRAALLQEWGRPLPEDLAPRIKALAVPTRGLMDLDGAISSAGGLRLEALTGELMLKDRPGVFAAGEMLDWEAPTGGWLITASLATGLRAGRAAAAHMAGKPPVR